MRPLRYSSNVALFQLTFLAVLLLDNFKGITAANMQPARDRKLLVQKQHLSKRNWQSLSVIWDERSLGEGLSADDDVYFAERRLSLPYTLGDALNPVLTYPLIGLRSGGNAFKGNTAADLGVSQNLKPPLDTDAYSIDGNEFSICNGKRDWKSLNIAWVKRRNSPQWKKFKGSWGKRETGWNNLNGMWGKRSNKDWQKINGSWGKRVEKDILDSN